MGQLDTNSKGAKIPYLDYSSYLMRVLFPDPSTTDLQYSLLNSTMKSNGNSLGIIVFVDRALAVSLTAYICGIFLNYVVCCLGLVIKNTVNDARGLMFDSCFGQVSPRVTNGLPPLRCFFGAVLPRS